MKTTIFLLCLIFSYGSGALAQVNDSLRLNHSLEYQNKQADSLGSFHILGEPRTPLKSSFYNGEMLKYDWRYQYSGRFLDPIEYTLLGLQDKVKTSGKVIVYDASVTSISDKAILNKKGIEVTSNVVIVNTQNSTLQIPIEYVGENPVEANFISNGEKQLISEYVNKSIAYSGVTPSRINIIENNGDFDISISKSDFTTEDIILRGHNIRSRVTQKELIEDINKNIETADLDNANKNLEIAFGKFPQNGEFKILQEKYEQLKQLNFINNNSNVSAIRLVEEGIGDYVVYDGLNPGKKFPIQEKSDFVQDLVSSIGEETYVVYLDVKGLNSEKAEAFISSVNIQMKKFRPDVIVKAAPENKILNDIFFEGEILGKNFDSQPLFNDYSGTQAYNVNLHGKTWKIGLGIEVKPYVIKNKSQKLINSFFKLFDKKVSKNSGWSLSDTVNNTRKDIEKKNKWVKPEDYDTFIKNELLGIDIVFIEEIK